MYDGLDMLITMIFTAFITTSFIFTIQEFSKGETK